MAIKRLESTSILSQQTLTSALLLKGLLPESKDFLLIIAVRTGLEPVTPCVTGMYSNRTELTHLLYEVATYVQAATLAQRYVYFFI